MVDHSLLRELNLAAILTGSHPSSIMEIGDEYSVCVDPTAITSGELCNDFETSKNLIKQRAMQYLIKAAIQISEAEYNAMDEYTQRVVVDEYTMVEDHLWFERQRCFQSDICKGGVCTCDNQKYNYKGCISHKPKDVNCTSEAVKYRQLNIALSLVVYLEKSDCAMNSMAGNGDPCSEPIKDDWDQDARMNAQDWEQRIKTKCAFYGECKGGMCEMKCKFVSNFRKACEAHKQQDLNPTCKRQ